MKCKHCGTDIFWIAVSPKTDPPKGVWRHKNDVFCTPFNEIDNVDTNLTQQEGTE
tara:strand:+ start:402 stop:566 length:165 start_codon:yes stop_codon:yes gene_type:complete